MINKERLVNNFINMVKINGDSGNEKSIALYLKDYYNAKADRIIYNENFSDEIFSTDNLIVYIEGTTPGMPPLLLSAHMDTIEPTTDLNIIIENDIIKTDGSTILGADDRAGIAVINEALNCILENKIPHPPVYCLFSVYEEKGMKGAKLVNPENIPVKFGFVLDSSAAPGKIIYNAPASEHLVIKIFGQAAHAAIHPEDGINAIKIAGNAIANLDTGRIHPEMTFNFGIIRGGRAINVVPDYVEIDADCRSLDGQLMEEKIHFIKTEFEKQAALLGGKIELVRNHKYSSFRLDEDSPVIGVAKMGIINSGLEPECIRYPGGSDANVLNNKGIPSVNLGIGYQHVHSHSESVSIENLTKSTEIVINIIKSAFQIFEKK